MARARAVAKGKTKASVKKKPVKAGSTMQKNVGGFINAKVVPVVKKKKQSNG